MEFIIGTENRAKVQAARDIILFHYPKAIITSVAVGSSVSDQPFGDEETRLGAINRALRASEKKEGAIGIGLEGGVRIIEGQMYLCNWGALNFPGCARFTAAGAQIPLPKNIATELLNGEELGPVIDRVYNSSGIRHKEGAIGMLTAGAVNRNDLFVHICQLLIGQLNYFQETR